MNSRKDTSLASGSASASSISSAGSSSSFINSSLSSATVVRNLADKKAEPSEHLQAQHPASILLPAAGKYKIHHLIANAKLGYFKFGLGDNPEWRHKESSYVDIAETPNGGRIIEMHIDPDNGTGQPQYGMQGHFDLSASVHEEKGSLVVTQFTAVKAIVRVPLFGSLDISNKTVDNQHILVNIQPTEAGTYKINLDIEPKDIIFHDSMLSTVAAFTNKFIKLFKFNGYIIKETPSNDVHIGVGHASVHQRS